jgi:hypothetical protein
VEIGKGLGIGKFLPFTAHSQKLYKSLKILGLKVPLSGHLEALSNGYWGQRKMSFWGLRSGIRGRVPRWARRHLNGKSEGILDGPTPMVRPELRRGYDRYSQDIGSSGESRGGTPRRVVSVTRGPQS